MASKPGVLWSGNCEPYPATLSRLMAIHGDVFVQPPNALVREWRILGSSRVSLPALPVEEEGHGE